MSKKVIFLDIDGTLAEPGHSEPPASAIEAVRKAQAAGNLVFLCSGRAQNETEQKEPISGKRRQ